MSNDPITYDRRSDDVRNLGEITRILESLYTHRTVLSLTHSDKHIPLPSMVMGVNEEARQFEIDGFDGSESLTPGTKITIHSKLNGAQIHFHTQLINREQSQEGWVYRLHYPQQLLYAQRRSAYRITLDKENVIPLVAHNLASRPFKGLICDISENGIAFVVSRERVDYRPLDRLDSCTLTVHGENVPCELEIRRIATLPSGTTRLVGARLVSSGQNASEIARAVRRLERSLLRASSEHQSTSPAAPSAMSPGV